MTSHFEMKVITNLFRTSILLVFIFQSVVLFDTEISDPTLEPRNAPRPRIAPVSSFRAFPENNSSTKDSMILFHGFHYFLHYAP